MGPVDVATTPANLLIDGQYYALSILDSSGAPVTAFDLPLVLTLVPPPGVDPATMSLWAIDPASGAMVQLQLQPNEDGTLSAALGALAPPANLAPTLSPTEPPTNDTPEADIAADAPEPDATAVPEATDATTERVLVNDGG
jgi:hypothetical protein